MWAKLTTPTNHFIRAVRADLRDVRGNASPTRPGSRSWWPGQVITNETIVFMRKLDVKEIHGYHAAHGLKLLKPAVLAGRKKPGADI